MTKLVKYLQRQMDNMTWPQLLVFKEKHGTVYYLCKNQKDIGKACLHMLKARLNPRYGYIQHPGPKKKIHGIKDELKKEDAEKLPEPYRNQALNVIIENAELREEWINELNLFKNAKKAVQQNDGNLAYMILLERRDHEYEGFNFEEPIIP